MERLGRERGLKWRERKGKENKMGRKDKGIKFLNVKEM